MDDHIVYYRRCTTNCGFLINYTVNLIDVIPSIPNYFKSFQNSWYKWDQKIKNNEKTIPFSRKTYLKIEFARI